MIAEAFDFAIFFKLEDVWSMITEGFVYPDL